MYDQLSHKVLVLAKGVFAEVVGKGAVKVYGVPEPWQKVGPPCPRDEDA
jgi:hypothetical protein